MGNGIFETDPQRIWAKSYAYNRPDVGFDEVRKILDEFERVKLLFRWTDPVSGKHFGYWIGIDKPGASTRQFRQGPHGKYGRSLDDQTT